MSFSKSKSKRFIESVSAAPPVGSYDVTKAEDKHGGPVTFEKGSRFIEKNEQTPGPADTQKLRFADNKMNASGISSISFATPCTPIRKIGQRISASATDLTSKDDLTKRIYHFEHRISELEKSLQSKIKEKNQAENKIKELAEDKSNLLIQLEEKEKDAAGREQTVLNNEIASLKQANSELEMQRKSIETDLDLANKNIAALKQQIENLEVQRCNTAVQTEDLESTISTLQVLLDQVRYEKRILEEKLFTLQHEIEDYKHENDNMQSKYEQNEAELGRVRDQLEEQQQRCGDLQVNASEVCQRLGILLQENKALEENIFNLEKNNELLIAEKSDMDVDLCKARNAKADLEEQIECLENTTTENLRGLTLKYQCLEETNDTMQKQLKEKEITLCSELEETKKCHQEMKDNFEAMKNAYQQLNTDYASVSSELDELERSCTERNTKLTAVEDENKDLNYMLQFHQSRAEKEHLKLSSKIDQMTESLQKKEDESLKNAEEIDALKRLNIENEQDGEVLFRRIDRLNEKIQHHETDLLQMKAGFELKTSLKDDTILQIKEELGKRIVDTQTKLSTAEHEFDRELEDERTRYDLLAEEYERLQSSNGFNELNAEVDLWRQKFEQLQAKVRPFQAQLESFENERLALVSENSNKESEIAKLADRYAQILGHQNNKQKIHHVIKIKEENLSLKKEVTKLRTQVAKQSKRPKNESPNLSRKTRFDPAKAFQHPGKENQSSRTLTEFKNSTHNTAW